MFKKAVFIFILFSGIALATFGYCQNAANQQELKYMTLNG